jgi:hypothetical protein
MQRVVEHSGPFSSLPQPLPLNGAAAQLMATAHLSRYLAFDIPYSILLKIQPVPWADL